MTPSVANDGNSGQNIEHNDVTAEKKGALRDSSETNVRKTDTPPLHLLFCLFQHLCRHDTDKWPQMHDRCPLPS